jgi:hypothetical protein
MLRIRRDDTVLVEVVEELGKESWGGCAELKHMTLYAYSNTISKTDPPKFELKPYKGEKGPRAMTTYLKKPLRDGEPIDDVYFHDRDKRW